MDPAALGAFFSGVGAVISAIVGLRVVERRMRRDCEQRIAEIRAAIHEGFELKE